MYPFFSGLGGYIFGDEPRRQPRPVGHRRREREVPEERGSDRPLEQGRASSARRSSGDIARTSSLKGKVAYYVTGPWFLGDIQKSGLKYAISAFPEIVPGLKAAPFLGVQGFMVTKFSSVHGVESLAKDLVANYMMRPASQLDACCSRTSRFPANLVAGSAGQGQGPEGRSARRRSAASRCRTSRRWRASGRTSALRGSARRRARARSPRGGPSSARSRSIAQKIG